MTFRLQGRHIAITYSRCDYALDDILAFLKNKHSGSRTVQHVIVCSETHQDGSFHRHAYVRYSGKVNITNPEYFKFRHAQCNIQPCRNVAAWNNYVRKDGDFVEWEEDATSSNGLYENAQNMGEADFFQWALRSKIQFGYAQRAWDTQKKAAKLITFDEDNNPFLDLNLPLTQELAGWHLSTNLTNVLVGPTGCGKTVYCFRNLLKPMLLISHIDDLKHFDPNLHRSILFDDMKFDQWPIQAQIHLCDRGLPRSIHRRYGTTLIPAGIQIAITCNENSFCLP
ncbi:Rep [Nepavirus]|uniref:Rep n=1 Tax=Nepavirus TaxID=1224510 RepID=UPI00027EDBCF|nr:Rep [Nepavirus]AFR11834.1 Rep [Nepavirus]